MSELGPTTRTYEKHLSECLHVMPSNAINKKAITNFNQRQIQQVFLYRLLAAPAESFLCAFVCDLSECEHAEDVNAFLIRYRDKTFAIGGFWHSRGSPSTRKVQKSAEVAQSKFFPSARKPLDQKKSLEVRQSLHHN